MFLLFVTWTGLAQGFDNERIDSIANFWKANVMHSLDTVKTDAGRALVLTELGNYYKFKKPDSGLYYAYKALELSRQIKFAAGEVGAIIRIGITQISLGNEAKALQMIRQGLKIAEQNNLIFANAVLQTQLGIIYSRSKHYAIALHLLKEQMRAFESLRDPSMYVGIESTIAETYLLMNQLDSALYYIELAHQFVQANDSIFSWATHSVLLNHGRIQHKLGNNDLALLYFLESLQVADEVDKILSSGISIAQVYQQVSKFDSSIYYAEKSLSIAQKGGFYSGVVDASVLLSGIYENLNPQKSTKYNKLALAYKDSLYNLSKAAAFDTFIDFDEQERQREIEAAKAEFQNRLRMNAILGSTFTLFIIAIFLFRNNRLKQKAKQKIERAYDQLKSTQSQLIQSEKMASLGELTAGIAHEIQNPLNFVNNFSEVNAELIDDLKKEVLSGDQESLLEIANAIKSNQEKINHHGKRAEGIVKSMLQHSRSSVGQKELTDINALCDEYLRLAYHGYRAREKSINTIPIDISMNSNFAPSLPNVKVVRQDIGRVLLNLVNNAFYAVREKTKVNTESYEPTVTVSTKYSNGSIEICIQDNGTGIPDSMKAKIFQPFFTTKPTGQGTGLGLSLSYDIIKAHGGTITLNSKEGEGAEFIIKLPV